MKKFNCLCKDKVTGFEMVAEDCSFNEAAMFLDKCAQILETIPEEVNGVQYMKFVASGGAFYYDECRGYLMAHSDR